MRVLIFDEDEEFGRMVADGLALYGHVADVVTDAAMAMESVETLVYSLLVVSVPNAARFLRQAKQVDPTLTAVMLTSHPDSAEAVELLRGGPTALAIDYIVKPEVALIRRLVKDIDRHFTRVQVGELVLDRKSRSAYWAGEPVALTPTEHQILTAFVLNPYRDLTYEELALAVYGESREHKDAVIALRAPISRLRAKLKKAAGRDILLAGYDEGTRLVPEKLRSPVSVDATVGDD